MQYSLEKKNHDISINEGSFYEQTNRHDGKYLKYRFSPHLKSTYCLYINSFFIDKSTFSWTLGLNQFFFPVVKST